LALASDTAAMIMQPSIARDMIADNWTCGAVRQIYHRLH